MERRQFTPIHRLSDRLRPADWLAAWQQRREQQLRRRLLAQVDTSLVWHDDCLIDTREGRSQRINRLSGNEAEQLAEAAAGLLAQRPCRGVLLLIPPARLVATPYDLGVADLGNNSLLRSALHLQSAQLLPACDAPLLLACSGSAARGLALWIRAAEAEALHAAFAARGLPLVALMPRLLAALPSLPLVDADAGTRTLIAGEGGRLTSWQTLAQRDLQQEDFAAQWQAACAAAGLAADKPALDASYWRSCRQVVAPQADYCFIPPAAQAAGQAGARLQRRRIAGYALAAGVALLALPFLVNQLRIAWLERSLEEALQASATARAAQEAVVLMEDAWAPLARFPQQDIAATLRTLDQFIDGGLSNFSVNRGAVEISGVVPDPALLVEQLAEQELFRAVVQSRSSSGSGDAARGARFGIRMQLTGTDFAAYEASLPPVEQLR